MTVEKKPIGRWIVAFYFGLAMFILLSFYFIQTILPKQQSIQLLKLNWTDLTIGLLIGVCLVINLLLFRQRLSEGIKIISEFFFDAFFSRKRFQERQYVSNYKDKLYRLKLQLLYSQFAEELRSQGVKGGRENLVTDLIIISKVLAEIEGYKENNFGHYFELRRFYFGNLRFKEISESRGITRDKLQKYRLKNTIERTQIKYLLKPVHLKMGAIIIRIIAFTFFLASILSYTSYSRFFSIIYILGSIALYLVTYLINYRKEYVEIKESKEFNH